MEGRGRAQWGGCHHSRREPHYKDQAYEGLRHASAPLELPATPRDGSLTRRIRVCVCACVRACVFEHTHTPLVVVALREVQRVGGSVGVRWGSRRNSDKWQLL